MESEQGREKVVQQGSCIAAAPPAAIPSTMTVTNLNSIEGWTTVTRRRRQTERFVLKGSSRVPIWKNVFSFFVTNLPDGCSVKDLRNEFGKCGEMLDAFVSKKKDKFGSTFGFIRFRNDQDKTRLLEKLNKIGWGGCKPQVSIPKFDRDGNPIQREFKYQYVVKPKMQEGGAFSGVDSKSVKNGVSFRDALMPSSKEIHAICVLERNGDEVKTGATLDGKTLLGYARDMEQLNKMRSELKLLGKEVLTIRYVGGLRVLVSFGSSEDANNMLSNRSIWVKWFFSLVWWKNQILEFERVAWLKLSGIPPSLWCDVLSDSIAARFGEVVQGSSAMPEDCNMSFDLVGVLAKTGLTISDSVIISYKGEQHSVWVQEVSTNWLPDDFYIRRKPGRHESSSLGIDSDDEARVHELEKSNKLDGMEVVGDSIAPFGEVLAQPENPAGETRGAVDAMSDISHFGETCENVSSGEAIVIETQAIRLNDNISLQTAVDEDLFGLDPIINMINTQEKEMGETTNMSVPSIDSDQEIRASVPDLNHSYHSTLSDHSEHSMHSVESSTKEDEAEITIGQIIPPISGASSDLRNPPPLMPKQAEKSQINRKGQKKVSKKASKKRNDMNWTSFIGGISSPEEDAAGAVTRTTNKNAIEIETQETVRVGELIGINLKGYEDQIQALIREEGVNPFLV